MTAGANYVILSHHFNGVEDTIVAKTYDENDEMIDKLELRELMLTDRLVAYPDREGIVIQSSVQGIPGVEDEKVYFVQVKPNVYKILSANEYTRP